MTVTKEHAQCTNMLLEAGAKSSSRDATGARRCTELYVVLERDVRA